MNCSIILVTALCLVLCALSAGCTSPIQAEIKPLETTFPITLPSTHPTPSTATVVSTPARG